MVFDAERYKDLVITARIDVGASTLWSEAVSIANLGNLLTAQQIDFIEYLERIPKGLIPNVNGLINTRKQQKMQMQQQAINEQKLQESEVSPDDISDREVIDYLRQNNPKIFEQLMRLSPENRIRALNMMRNGTQNEPYNTEQEVEKE